MKYTNTWKSELFNDKRHNSSGNKLRTSNIDYLKISLFLNRI